jgi:hypothetical protein
MSMASTTRTNLGRRLRLAVAGAAVATVLTINDRGQIVGLYENPSGGRGSG